MRRVRGGGDLHDSGMEPENALVLPDGKNEPENALVLPDGKKSRKTHSFCLTAKLSRETHVFCQTAKLSRETHVFCQTAKMSWKTHVFCQTAKFRTMMSVGLAPRAARFGSTPLTSWSPVLPRTKHTLAPWAMWAHQPWNLVRRVWVDLWQVPQLQVPKLEQEALHRLVPLLQAQRV